MDFAAEQTSISGQFMTYCYISWNPKRKKKKIYSVIGPEKKSFLIFSKGLRAHGTHHTLAPRRIKSYM